MGEIDYEKMYRDLLGKHQELVKLGSQMRTEQKKYFRSRNRIHLEEVCKPLEHDFDKALIGEKYGNETSLFNQADDVDQEGG